MRKKFSQKYGFADIRDSLQIETMDDALKNRLWNTFLLLYVNPLLTEYMSESYGLKNDKEKKFIYELYDQFFKTSDEPPISPKKSLKIDVKKRFFNLKWFEVYDFIELVPEIFHDQSINIQFRKQVNVVLEEEMSGYRFVDNYIAPIVDEVEIQEIEEAVGCEYTGVKQHISNAIEHLSDRENPDYVNSIKESISAVESLCKIYLGNNSPLGSCLNQLSFEFSPTFKQGISKFYNWTSSDAGIRHGSTDEEMIITFEEAKFMLVICSSFINYLIAKKGND